MFCNNNHVVCLLLKVQNWVILYNGLLWLVFSFIVCKSYLRELRFYYQYEGSLKKYCLSQGLIIRIILNCIFLL